MTRIFSKLVLGTALVILVSPPDIFAGRGGGYGGGGGGYRGGGGGGYRGGGGGGMGGSPSFSQPHQPTSQSGRTPLPVRQRLRGRQSPRGYAAAGAGYANRNQSQAHPAGAAAAGAGYANNNQSLAHPAGAAAAGGRLCQQPSA